VSKPKPKRITVAVSDEGYDAISFLAKLNRSSRGRVLGEVVEMALPMLITSAGAFEAAEAMTEDERDKFFAAMRRAEDALLTVTEHTVSNVTRTRQ
jgi:serine kinase of HPr protein (carbohydrate metabolism regulator)